MSFRPSLLLLMCLSWHWCYAAAVADKGDKTDTKAGASADGAQGQQQPPSLELLEFLGSWENGNGEWVDPAEFADDSFEQLTSTESGKDNE
ncbi:MAG: hypothetical protein P8126_03915 [Gammaproteobacteria bacterium]|jgi:hypothetical protein